MLNANQDESAQLIYTWDMGTVWRCYYSLYRIEFGEFHIGATYDVNISS